MNMWLRKKEKGLRDRVEDLRKELAELHEELARGNKELNTARERRAKLEKLEEENRLLREDPKTILDKELIVENTRLKNALRNLKTREETTVRQWVEETLRELERVVNTHVEDLQHSLRMGQTESVYRERKVIAVKKKEKK